MRDYENVCLCCMRKNSLKSLFDSEKKGVCGFITYLEMIQTCCSVIKIAESDGLPRVICCKCIIQLKAAFKFKRRVEGSYHELKEKIKCLSFEDDKGENKNDTFDVASSVKSEIISEELDAELNVQTEEVMIFEQQDVKCETDNIGMREDNTDNTFIYDLVVELTDFNKVSASSLSQKEEELKPTSENEYTAERKRLKTIDSEDVDLSKFLSSKVKTVCHICKKKCQTATKLRDHFNSNHLGVKGYYCNICKKYYASEERHKPKHSLVKSFTKKCLHCNKTFDKKSVYYAHIKKYGLNFTCECGVSCRNAGGLYRHRQVHKGKRMMCHLCSKSFLRHDNLKEHIRRHNKDATYACDICPKKFFNPYDLKLHVARHVKEKNYQCDECDVMFKTKKDVYQHTWRHHKGEKKYSCKFCGKAFRRSDHRNVHQRSVHSLDEKSMHKCES